MTTTWSNKIEFENIDLRLRDWVDSILNYLAEIENSQDSKEKASLRQKLKTKSKNFLDYIARMLWALKNDLKNKYAELKNLNKKTDPKENQKARRKKLEIQIPEAESCQKFLTELAKIFLSKLKNPELKIRLTEIKAAYIDQVEKTEQSVQGNEVVELVQQSVQINEAQPQPFCKSKSPTINQIKQAVYNKLGLIKADLKAAKTWATNHISDALNFRYKASWQALLDNLSTAA